MAHNISKNEKTGQYSFYSVKEKAWHGLGHIADKYETSAEVLEKAGLNFIVEKRPLFTYDSENMFNSRKENNDSDIIIPEIEVPNYYATVRTDNDKVLGVVGSEYLPIQNRESFAFFDAIAGKDGVFYETAGALGNGERIFITAKLPSYIKVGDNDLIEQYLFFTTTHNGKGSIIAALTPVRIVCNNTLNIALGNCSNKVVIRHTEGAKERIKEAHKVMGMVNTLSPLLEQCFNHWTSVKITDPEVKKLVQIAMAPNKEVLDNIKAGKEDENSTAFKNIVDDVFGYAMMSETQQLQTTKGTLFGAFNAVTGYFQNVRKYKDNDAKIKSLFLDGTAEGKAQKTFDLCSAYAKDGDNALALN